MKHTEKLARLVRIITVPPFMISLLTITVSMQCDGVFLSISDVCATVFFLGIIPFLAYPMQRWLPTYKRKGREGQRELAFLCTIAGYICAWGYGLLTKVSDELQFIYNAYLLSVLILFVINKGLHIRASGHACGTIAPAVFTTYFLNIGCSAIYLLLAVASMWASVYLKRHKLSDTVWGVLVFLCAYFIALLFL